jgi:hypothetical protein
MFSEAVMAKPGDGVGKAALAEPIRHKRGLLDCHTPVLKNRTKAYIRVPRMFKSHAWQQYDKQMKYYE